MLKLPIAPERFNAEVLTPALALLPKRMDTRAARVLVTAICLQESGLNARRQILSGGKPGAAAGLSQMELGGGVRGVLSHPSTMKHAHAVCASFEVEPTSAAVWNDLPYNDVLAAAFARLLLFSDPQAIPQDVEGCWQMYLRTWRPGAFKRDPVGLRAKWKTNFRRALAAVPQE